jgi:hypothetical protein
VNSPVLQDHKGFGAVFHNPSSVSFAVNSLCYTGPLEIGIQCVFCGDPLEYAAYVTTRLTTPLFVF